MSEHGMNPWMPKAGIAGETASSEMMSGGIQEGEFGLTGYISGMTPNGLGLPGATVAPGDVSLSEGGDGVRAPDSLWAPRTVAEGGATIEGPGGDVPQWGHRA